LREFGVRRTKNVPMMEVTMQTPAMVSGSIIMPAWAAPANWIEARTIVATIVTA